MTAPRALTADDIVGPERHGVYRVADGLTLSLGQSEGIADIIRQATGDVIEGPFLHLGLVDDDGRSFAGILHWPTDEDTVVQISAPAADLPWSTTVVRSVVRVAFADMGAASLVTAALLNDHTRRRLLHRLGFREVVRTVTRVAFALRRSDLPLSLARHLARPH